MANREGKYGRSLAPESGNSCHPTSDFRCFPVSKALPHIAARAARSLVILPRPAETLFLRETRVRSHGSGWFSVFCFLFSLFLSGCGAPGDPVPPSPTVPVAVSDLVARQAGDGVELVFSLPAKSVSGEKLGAAPAIEIVRGSLQANGAPDPKSFRVVYTIPGALVGNYFVAGHVRFTDPISPEESKAHPGASYAYLVRTRLSTKRASPDSNVVSAFEPGTHSLHLDA